VSTSWAAVVVNYEAGDALVNCVRSLQADDSAGGPPEIVVVDNGSSDGSVARLRREFPDVEVVDLPTNLGYAAAANRGTARTTTPIVAVCNADLVVARGAGAAMAAAFDDPTIGAAGPCIRNLDGSVYPSVRRDPGLVDAAGHAVIGLVWPRNPFTRRYHETDADPSLPRDVDWISGAAMWFRRRALESVGGWDDGYFMYVEEVDLCWRLRAAGWRIVYDPSGAITHERGVATARHPVRMTIEHHRSWYRFASKRWRGPRRLLLPLVAAFLAVRAAVLVALHGLAAASRRPRRHG